MDLRRRYLTWRYGAELYGFLLAITSEPAAIHAYGMALAVAPLSRLGLYAEAYAAVSPREAPGGPAGTLALRERALVVLSQGRGMSWRHVERVLRLGRGRGEREYRLLLWKLRGRLASEAWPSG